MYMSEVNLYQQMNHRIDLIEKICDEIEKQEEDTNFKILKNQDKFKKDVDNLLNEVQDLKVEVNFLIKRVYAIGEKLKDKIDKRSVDKMKEIIDTFNFEDILHRNELEKTYKNYAKFG